MILETNKIKNLIPYLGSLLLICGYLKLSIYYNYFNIQISDYLEITEILTLFFYDAIKYSTIVFLAFLFTFLIDTQESIEENENEKNDIIDTNNFFLRLKKFLIFRLNLIGSIVIFLIFTLISYYVNPKKIFYFILITSFLTSILILIYFLFEFKRKYKISYGKELNSTYYNLIIIFILFVTYLIQSSFLDIRKTTEGKNLNISFKYYEKNIESSDQILYVGETKGYLFLFDTKKKSTLVFSRNDINNLEIKKPNK